jgi:hypothetical protein
MQAATVTAVKWQDVKCNRLRTRGERCAGLAGWTTGASCSRAEVRWDDEDIAGLCGNVQHLPAFLRDSVKRGTEKRRKFKQTDCATHIPMVATW